MTVIFHIVVVWVVTSCSLVGLNPEDGDSMFHRNVRIHPEECVVSQPRRSQTRISNLDTRWKWVVSFTLTHLISKEWASTADWIQSCEALELFWICCLREKETTLNLSCPGSSEQLDVTILHCEWHSSFYVGLMLDYVIWSWFSVLWL
jgi:hypothetical protein